MICLEKFKEVDGSFAVHSKVADDESVSTLCTIDHFQDGGVVFVKNQRFFNKLCNQLNDSISFNKIGVVFQESFFNKQSIADELDILEQLRFYGTVASIDTAMSYFSKLFFDVENQRQINTIDGRPNKSVRIHPTSLIAENVFLGENVEVDEGVVIHSGCVILSNSKIGKNTIIYPNVVIYRNVSIGRNCIIHANTTIGSDGFSYINSKGRHLKVWHFGGVIIEDDVEIGSNTSIDQGTFSPTVIGAGSKIDNQVHIAHNCQLGTGVIICGQSGLAGSVIIGDYVVIGGAVNIAPDVIIGKKAQIGGMAGVTGNIPDNAVYGGHPARPLTDWLKSSATLRRISKKKNFDHAKESNVSS